LLYGRGWLLTHYLTFEKSRAGQLTAYLEAISAGKSSLEAARAAFGDLHKLDGELDSYLQRDTLLYARLPVPELAAGAITVRPLTAGEAAMMPVRLQSKRGVDKALAQRVVVEARQLAAPYANDPGARIALAEAEFDAGNDDGAEAAADRALAAAPNDRVALEYKGRARMRRLRLAHASDPQAWQEARSWFIKANHLEPDDGMALELFYQSFLNQGIAPTKSAVAGLEVALSAVPQDGSLRFMLAQQYLHDGRTKEARRLLTTLAYDPHRPADNPAAQLIALIDKNDGAAIAAALQKGGDAGAGDAKDAGKDGGDKPTPGKAGKPERPAKTGRDG
jgi:tetratricopeptide (TPR) repeat protein